MFILGGFDVVLELADTVILMKKMRERDKGGFPFPFCLGKAAWDVWFKRGSVLVPWNCCSALPSATSRSK